MARDIVPKYNELMWPTVVALRALGGSGSISEIEAQVAEGEGLSEEQQSELLGDGPRTKLADRLHWARSYLKGAGLATNVSRGVWALTQPGLTIAEDEVEPARQAFLKAYRKQKATDKAADGPADVETPDDSDDAWRDRLLEVLLSLDPDAFERLCQRLLRKAGFIRTTVTQSSNDKGIDGLGVYRVSLVSFQVFFQAKRWRNSVGSKEVRDFRGAMAGRGEKGLLITTSTFTAEAKAEASRDGAPPVDLVDGATLCDLLVEHRIGVRVTERVELDIEVDEAALRGI